MLSFSYVVFNVNNSQERKNVMSISDLHFNQDEYRRDDLNFTQSGDGGYPCLFSHAWDFANLEYCTTDVTGHSGCPSHVFTQAYIKFL